MTITSLPVARIASGPVTRSPWLRLFCLRQKVHREMDAGQVAAGHWQIATDARPGGDQHRIKLFEQARRGKLVAADARVAAELHPFGFHLPDAAPNLLFAEFEIGDAVHQQPAGAAVALEHHDGVTGAVELLRGRHAGRSTADDGHLLAGARLGRLGLDPAFAPAAIGDLHFDLFDRNGVFVDAQHASVFARRGADAAGELGEVVGAVQLGQRGLPLAARDEFVPVGIKLPSGQPL